VAVEEWAPVLLEQGRYAELSQRIDGVEQESQDFASAQLWRARCLLEQGYVHAGYEALRCLPVPEAALGSFSTAGDTAAEIELWRGFLFLYGNAGEHTLASTDRFEQATEAFLEPGRYSGQVKALAVDLCSRAERMRYVLAGQGAEHRAAVMARIAGAADGYRDTGMVREALAALRRAAWFGVDGRAAERSAAHDLLVRARDEAQVHGLAVAAAEARLGLAGLALRDVCDGRPEEQEGAALAEFDRLEEVFSQAGHAFGAAKVRWAVARLLLRYGVAAGVDFALAAAQEFAVADSPSGEQPIWAALAEWFTLHGDPVSCERSRENQSRLAAAIGYGIALEVRGLDEANQAFRSGDIARARPLLAGTSLSSGGLTAARRVMAATSASAVGLADEARALLEDVVADLTDAGASMVLGDALSVLASLTADRDHERAMRLLDRAATVAQEAEALAEQAKYLGQAAWTMVLHRSATHSAPLVDDDVRDRFDEVVRLLSGQSTLEARAELINVYQYRGQAAFFAADWDECVQWLTKAEVLARSLGLNPHLAAVLSHQGLALINIGRRSGPVAYDHAASRFDESRVLYEECGLRAMLWQIVFMRALCELEAARWPPSPPAQPEPTERLARAADLMEFASREIDWLRRSSERGAVGRRQEVWMAFSVNKQTFYDQGFQLAWDARHDARAAWNWLERAKGRALLDALSDADEPEADDMAGPASTAQSAPMTFEELRERLAAEQQACGGRRLVVAQYLCTPTRTLLFIARSDDDTPHVSPVPLDHAALRGFAATTFRTPGGVRMMQQDSADGGMTAWHRFSALLAPLSQWSNPEDVVYLIPHGVLHDLPLHTLLVDGVPLIERNPVCYVPAAAVLRHTLGAAPDAFATAAAVFGDSRGDLPSARQEAVAVADLLDVEPVLGDHVDRDTVLAALAEDSPVHIAGHGQVSAADGFDSHMLLTGTDALRAADLLSARCSARLVVLSGCETGVSEQRAGDELVGFTRALLLSGVPSIVSSQWRVKDASTQDLLYQFHRLARDPAIPLAEALRRAMLHNRALPGREHLYHWAGFTLVGSWR
jgi:CHAT domain